MINQLSQRLLNPTESRRWNASLTFDVSSIDGCKREVNCGGTVLEVACKVNKDSDGLEWLGIVFDLVSDKTPTSWYPHVAFGYRLLSESCVFSCRSDCDVFCGKSVDEGL